MTIKPLETLSTEEYFFGYNWIKATKKADELNVKEPSLPRKRRRLARFEIVETTLSPDYEALISLSFVLDNYSISLVIKSIPSYKIYSEMY